MTSRSMLAVCRALLILLSLSAGLILVTAPASGDDPEAVEVRTIEQTYVQGAARWLEIDQSLGSLRIEGTTSGDGRVHAEVVISCTRENVDNCRRRAARMRLAPRLDGDTLAVRLKGTPRGRLSGLEATMVVRAPASMALEVDMSGGDITIQGMRNHIEIDSAAGDVEIRYPQALLSQVRIDLGAGDGELRLVDGSLVEVSGFPRSIDWKGAGLAEIEVDMGAGEAHVLLD
ncbi:MAG: hypothetical protein AAGN46_10565 [Acidobacteriota bacterium]